MIVSWAEPNFCMYMYGYLGVTPLPERELASCTIFGVAWVSIQFTWALLGVAIDILDYVI